MSTREVESVLSLVDFLQEVNVYGVSVPGVEDLPHFKPPTALWAEGCFPDFTGGRAVGVQPVNKDGPSERVSHGHCELGDLRMTGVFPRL